MLGSLISSVALITFALVVDPLPPDGPNELAEFLMEQNAKSMTALGSMSYRFTETYEQFSRNRPPYRDERRGSYRRNWYGELMECTWGAREEMIGGKQLGTFERTDRYVVNLEYLSHWTVDSTTPAMIFYRDGNGAFSRRAEAELGMSGSERQHLFAFGPGERALKEELLKLSTTGRYEANARRLADPDKANRFELEWGFIHPKNNGRATPMYRFILDGDRGYLVTHGESIYRPGMNLFEWDIELAQVENVWYPKTVSYRRWSPIKHPATQPADMLLLYAFKTTIANLKVDEKFDDTQFQIAALGMPDGNVVCSHDEDGNVISHYVQDGELIDEDQARQTGLTDKYDELMMRRIEESRSRKPVTPATQRTNR